MYIVALLIKDHISLHKFEYFFKLTFFQILHNAKGEMALKNVWLNRMIQLYFVCLFGRTEN